MRRIVLVLTFVAFAGALILCKNLTAGEEKISIDKLPKAVADAMKKQFPKAELVGAVGETDDGKTVYEVTAKENGKNIDVTLNADGTIVLIEKEIAADDLPQPVAATLAKQFPKSVHKLIEAVYEMADGKPVVDFYEIQLKTAEGEELEVSVEANGQIKSDALDDEWTHDFSSDKDQLASTGRNPYFVLEPGYQLVLEDDDERLTVTVLNETKMIDGVETRVIEERETKDGKLVEVSRNYFSISKRTNNVYYFGEEVDMYKDGAISGHGGSWISGMKGAKFGLALPSVPLVGAKYQQEVAPGVAMDRGEIESVGETVKVPAGKFTNCLKIEETTPLEPDVEEYKVYAPGVGLVQDGSLKLVRYGKIELQK